MSPDVFLNKIIRPSWARIDEALNITPSFDAERMLLAIAGQESNMDHRYQISRGMSAGPARGWWQFERGGGVVGVMRHPASRDRAAAVCRELEVEFDDHPIWRALEGHDALATAFARLLLWTDPRHLPITERAGWDYYIDNWRPGKPHPDAWPRHWAAANRALRD
jgi:hypothetical protein